MEKDKRVAIAVCSNAELLSSTCTTTVLVDLSLPTNETSYVATSTSS